MRRKPPLGLLSGGTPPAKRTESFWFQLNKHHHLQTLATKGHWSWASPAISQPSASS